MADIKIPFKYCRIERAAQFLNCEIEDLLTLGLENKITINVKLNGGRSYLIVSSNVSDAEKWIDTKVPLADTSMRQVSITDYSIFKFDTLDIDDSNDDIKVNVKPLFKPVEWSDDVSVSCEGRAYGLWRLKYEIDDLLCNKVAYLNSPIFIPTLPEGDNLASQLLFIHDQDCEPDDDNEEYEDVFYNRITDKDLWITAFDVRRLLDCNGDYHTLESLNTVKQVANMESKLQTIHPTKARHDNNREQVLNAALRLLLEQPNIINDYCRKKDGSINYAAFARELKDRKTFFPNGESPIKTEERLSGILSEATKAAAEK